MIFTMFSLTRLISNRSVKRYIVRSIRPPLLLILLKSKYFMMNTDDIITGIRRLPMDLVDYEQNSWYFKVTKSHILSSKCTGPTESCAPPTDKIDSRCRYCYFTQNIALPHLPDMVFASNILTLDHNQLGLTIEFNAYDALRLVDTEKLKVQVACSEEWKEYRNCTGLTQRILKAFDWTFCNDYKGSLSGPWIVTPTDERINVENLKKKDAILFFDELTLFEDELHDNGIAQLTVRVRVMSGVFFILLRFFLRVDNVLIKIHDTRYYHEFDKNYIIREYTTRESKISELKVPTYILLDANTVVGSLPLVTEINEKLSFPETSA